MKFYFIIKTDRSINEYYIVFQDLANDNAQQAMFDIFKKENEKDSKMYVRILMQQEAYKKARLEGSKSLKPISVLEVYNEIIK